VIYFIQSGKSDLVKIGYAADPQTRLRQLQCGNPEPLRLIATKDGEKDAEGQWHRRLAHLRVRGEWFRWCDEMRTHVRPMLADPDEMRNHRIRYARDLVAGRPPDRETCEALYGGGLNQPLCFGVSRG
jgi:hypothetical protein